ncbi:hypothetical protein ASPZODRAFT_152671 [Penicilliopsis zonata CBS 506.65]|uniref:DUF8004 domain-containing protein n=1 Tax=Penicilliopsis zonata CBS 506.65 TaxID=1073090 RepID=A0A1L9SEI1_9EURO|nr:hypothetical protein ASPZODRAFT_152671 [Penicilliopsis zonata CBS 506.65]OJJ45635.1 hypothetical protein ASPZODRAFT_152671 [Penicilliopsis zonata CBS 506.65]
MLSAPVKQAKRISSLFSLGSHSQKDQGSSNNSSPVGSPGLVKGSPDQLPRDQQQQHQQHHRRSSSRHTRGGTSPHVDPTEPRTIVSPGPIDQLDLDSPLQPPPSLLALNQDLADTSGTGPDGRPQSRGRSSSAGGLFVPGTGPDSRPGTPSKRRSWMPGRMRASSMDRRVQQMPNAWIAGLDQKVPYELDPLVRGQQIPELWSEQGDTLVYLFPQNTGRPASFRVDSSIFVESQSLTFLARGTDMQAAALEQQARRLSLGGPASPALSAQDRLAEHDAGSSGSRAMGMDEEDDGETQQLHLYLPVPLNSDVSNDQSTLSQEDTETLVLFRNLFAFLLGQSLIATPRSPSLFAIFMDISTLLARFEFSNLDGSNFGETATTSFANYCEELHLADVRKSREKTIEAIVLGERLRYYPLYLEGFVHGVGKLDELKQLRSPKFGLIHPVTQKRMERGFIDLDTRLRILNSKLDDFDFPSLWSGIANSTTSAESKVVRFKAWKAAFLEFRRFTMQFYRQKYGSWPPKAHSKKNAFEESGLNRLLLRDLYHDFADLYDLLVNRTSLTTRTVDLAPLDAGATADPRELTLRALRQILSEYDRSTPPVQPPIPFDTPQLPTLDPLHRKPVDAKKENKLRSKKLKDVDINAVLMGSYTRESIKPTPWIESFMQFERRAAHGKNLDDIMDLRCGQWIFLYAVIQSLPMLIVDVADIRYTEGVEYLLCVAPRGGAPWIQNDSQTARSWFGVAGGAGVVSLPSDVVINGVEGVYRRSHCWRVAEQWAEAAGALLEPSAPNVPWPLAGSAAAVDDNYDMESSISSPYPAQQSSTGSMSDHLQQQYHLQQQQATPLMPPGTFTPPPTTSPPPIPAAIPRTNSPALRPDHRYSIYPGLEALPLPAGVAPMEPPARPVSRFNPNMSFDDILKEMPKDKKTGKR